MTTQMHCGNCFSYRASLFPDMHGECWSGDRMDGDMSNGPAGYHLSHRVCEAWMGRDGVAWGVASQPTPNPNTRPRMDRDKVLGA